ncbi:hypothetical protein GCM10009765_21630 [Fodinicola feengrottensis]|uniref:TraD/TraG TraM recognition site domain-containing protein n=1 Tax=Fodinicola feengrottensis TaxID=435914 RepID=A0ABN2GIN9_9ACTN
MSGSNGEADLAPRSPSVDDLVGWEFVPQPAAVPSPLANDAPVWVDEHPPAQPGWSKYGLGGMLAGAGVLVCCAGMLVTSQLARLPADDVAVPVIAVVISVISLVLLVLSGVVSVFVGMLRESSAVVAWRRDRQETFRLAQISWAEAVRAHDEREQFRTSTGPVLFPITLQGNDQIDVFGGTATGWMCLLTTLSLPRLGGGAKILVLDFSEYQVAGGLAQIVGEWGRHVRTHELPAALDQFALLQGLPPDHLAEVLAESLTSLRKDHQDAASLRRLDVRLIKAVASRLDGPTTFARLVAGMRLLCRLNLPDEGSLSNEERRALVGCIDDMVSGDREVEELRFLIDQFDLLAHPGEGQRGNTPLWPESGLTVISAVSPLDSRRDMTERVLSHLVLHQLRDDRGGAAPNVLVVAGADKLGAPSLESLSRQTRRLGVRLLLLFEHLREDAGKLLGKPGSVTMLMQLGNPEEARIAADFIGRDYQFSLSQITKQTGENLTHGSSQSWGDSQSRSLTNSLSGSDGESSTWEADSGRLFSPDSKSRSTSTDMGVSDSQTFGSSWQDAINKSLTITQSEGTTVARGYEYLVEPVVIQRLDPTAFILVNAGQEARRWVDGDCDPTIVGRDGVSPVPYRDAIPAQY